MKIHTIPSKLFPSMRVYTRTQMDKLEQPYEKPVILPDATDMDLGKHAWADARFATDIMAEHGLFFALLMPPELAAQERREALEFSEEFRELHHEIHNVTPPNRSEVKSFVTRITDRIKPFIEYKSKMSEAQKSGNLRSLVWPLFFDHTRHEAERWTRRLDQLAKGEPQYDRKEVVSFWTNIMDEHARFVAHLLDPEEFELIEKANGTSKVFRDLDSGGLAKVVKTAAKNPKTVTESLTQNPEVDAVMSAAETILDFKTKAARDIQMGKIKSIIDPRLADHIRREAVKFIDELRRAE
jgi:hypothetical protein